MTWKKISRSQCRFTYLFTFTEKLFTHLLGYHYYINFSPMPIQLVTFTNIIKIARRKRIMLQFFSFIFTVRNDVKGHFSLPTPPL